MSREELKALLHQKIDATNNDALLERVNFWMELNMDLEEPYILTPAEREAVQEGLEGYKNGRIISHEDFEKEMDEWEKK